VLWRECRDRCRVRCFWDEEAEVGHLVHRPGGSERAQWVFDYDRGSAEHNDENGYRSGAHAFCPGEYVIGDPASEMHTFRVISVRPAT
jgi:hypothetical protein